MTPNVASSARLAVEAKLAPEGMEGEHREIAGGSTDVNTKAYTHASNIGGNAKHIQVVAEQVGIGEVIKCF